MIIITTIANTLIYYHLIKNKYIERDMYMHIYTDKYMIIRMRIYKLIYN